MSHPPPDSNIPAALTRLFAEGDHFLRPSEEDMLLDPSIEDEPATVAAIAAAAAADAQAQAVQDGAEVQSTQDTSGEGQHLPLGEGLGIPVNVGTATHTPHDLHTAAEAHHLPSNADHLPSEHIQEPHLQNAEQMQPSEQLHPHESLHNHNHNHTHNRTHSQSHSHSHAGTPLSETYQSPHPVHPDPEPERKQSALEVFAGSLRSENDRLRRAISTLEAQGVGLDAVSVGTVPVLPLSEMEEMGDDLGITQHTLRQLASAAAGETFSFPGLESLQQLDHQFEPESDNLATMDDFLHALVGQVTVARAGGGDEDRTRVDPFEVTRKALSAELEQARAQIEEKNAEITLKQANRKGEEEGSAPVKTDAGEEELKTVTKNLEATRARASVLRDTVLRVKSARDTTALAVLGMEAELAVLADGHEGGRAQASVHALREVRGYVEEVLKTYKEKGKLPAPPLPSLPPLMLASMTPPSSLPKKRGRPPRSAAKTSVVPASLAHLVPNENDVAARAEHAPIRRKGVKRNKVELEREQARISEEAEMMKNLARMGVWKGDEWLGEGV